MPLAVVRRTYLALRAPESLRPAAVPSADVRVERRAPCTVAEYRALYAAVGERWHWLDRNAWTDDALAAHLARPTVHVHVLLERDTPIGYYELEEEPDGSVQLVYFGLVEAVHGRGLGGWLLTQAARDAWALGARVVWLHTCTLDGPHAIANYLARGFVPFRDAEYVSEITTRATPRD
jgi:GNAT superfamily N-acetyltransferase